MLKTKKGDTIDLSIWQTQTDYARENNMLLVTVSQWVRRAKRREGELKIDCLDVPELGITLVRRVGK